MKTVPDHKGEIMNYLGIDIGSTSIKTVVLSPDKKLLYSDVIQTSWDSGEKANEVLSKIHSDGFAREELAIVATGYGRVNIRSADKAITEISCHAKGAAFIFDQTNATVIDIGGQDTKIIALRNGKVSDFLMNDKCSAGTGKFLQIMAETMKTTLPEMCEMARDGADVQISSMCTVFAESEVISLIAKGTPQKDIARAIIRSMANKVRSLCSRLHDGSEVIYLTGGLCELDYVIETLSEVLGAKVYSAPEARYAGAIGAALFAMEL